MSAPESDEPETIVWRLHLASSRERVYELLTTDEGRAGFWAESAIESEGVIHFRFIGGEEERGRILERSPPRRFRLEYFGAEVAFELDDDGQGGTDLTLRTWGYRPEDRDEVLPGWLNVLLPLKAWADFGVDLRSHDPKRSWRQRYVDQ